MKLLADSEPVYTPKGWVNHGDLNIGDEVFTPYGETAKVINKSPKGIADHLIEFTNGETIKCNGDHLWTVYNRGTRRWKTRNTESLIKLKLYSGNRAVFSITKY